jgi:hypothetical protein
VFSVQSMPRCHKQDKLVRSQLVGELVSELEDCWGSVVVSCRCLKMVAEDGERKCVYVYVCVRVRDSDL